MCSFISSQNTHRGSLQSTSPCLWHLRPRALCGSHLDWLVWPSDSQSCIDFGCRPLRGWASRLNPFAGGVTKSWSELSNLALCVYYWRMLSGGLNPGVRRTLWMALGFLCCALLALPALCRLPYWHPDGQTVQSDCALCHTAHLVVQPAIPQSLPPSVLIVAAILAALQPARPRHFSVFSLFTRPPPVDIAFA